MKKKYDLTVAYRIYPLMPKGEQKEPPVFLDNKLKLSELCLHSFKKALGGLNAKIIVLLDNCPNEYEQLFRKYFDKEDLEILMLNGLGNVQTFLLQIEKLLLQNYSENIYFAEDDYFYLPNTIHLMLDFLNSNKNADFITPYDHPDYYRLEIHNHDFLQKSYNDKNWKTASSTCLTFMTTKTVLKKTKPIFLTYKNKNTDASIWMALTKYNTFNFKNLLIFMFIKRDFVQFQVMVKLWFFCRNQILFGEKYNLFHPKPTFATHMVKSCLAPDVNWDKLFNNSIKEINF